MKGIAAINISRPKPKPAKILITNKTKAISRLKSQFFINKCHASFMADKNSLFFKITKAEA